MNKEIKEAIGNLKIIAEYIGENYFFGKQGIENLKKDINVTLNYLNHLHKELEEQEFKLLARERGEAELETLIDQLKEEINKKDKKIELIIDDFQAEGYFKEMTYEQVKKYYDNRNELKQEINTLPLNLDLTAK